MIERMSRLISMKLWRMKKWKKAVNQISSKTPHLRNLLLKESLGLAYLSKMTMMKLCKTLSRRICLMLKHFKCLLKRTFRLNQLKMIISMQMIWMQIYYLVLDLHLQLLEAKENQQCNLVLMTRMMSKLQHQKCQNINLIKQAKLTSSANQQ